MHLERLLERAQTEKVSMKKRRRLEGKGLLI